MPKIKQLSEHEAQKIAAGEVVERPAHIVKELVENAIDAGATRINIYVEDGGKQLIRIVDNGYGMDSIDAQKCFDRHATSKITRVDELEAINTFGFRGEALASIASVSKITLLTKEENTLEGTHVLVEANTIKTVAPIACTTGTDISIQELFFNIPARKKFLKTTQTEWRAIQLLFNAFCFAYPHIHFTLFSEGKQVFNNPTMPDLKNRALQIFEPVAHKRLLAISNVGDISFQGIISDHQHYRYDRTDIYFFVNKRWIKNQHVTSAFIKAYAQVIPHGRYPIAAIDITVPSPEVDINIHPRKEEVKFLHPRRVEQAIQQAAKVALEKNITKNISGPTFSEISHNSAYFNPFDFDPSLKKKSEFVSFDKLRTNGNEDTIDEKEGKIEYGYNQSNPFVLSSSKETNTNILSLKNSNSLASAHQSLAESDEVLTKSEMKNGVTKVIGQYHNTYLLIEKEDGLFLVDQHAAHERILYEFFSQRFHDIATVQLLFPQIITLNTQDMDIIIPHLDILIHHGIFIEQCASDQLMVQSLPVHLKNESITDIIKETISWIIEYQTLDQDSFKKTINHKLQAQMACKAAVKAGDVLTQEKMEQLLSDLEKTSNRFSCPHGRPTGWLLSLAEIEKKFRRRL